MCGRYSLHSEPDEWSDTQVPWRWADWLRDWLPQFNVAPSVLAPVVANTAEPSIEMFRFGLVPHWAKDVAIGNRLINARAETVAVKPAFKEAFAQRRCVVLIDGFYEWQRRGRSKAPYYIRRRDKQPFGLAGLWENWREPEGRELRSFAIVTTRPNPIVEPIHDRMPVILAPEAYNTWLAPGRVDQRPLQQLLRPSPAEALEAHEVSNRVNAPKNNDASCIEPFVAQTSLF